MEKMTNGLQEKKDTILRLPKAPPWAARTAAIAGILLIIIIAGTAALYIGANSLIKPALRKALIAALEKNLACHASMRDLRLMPPAAASISDCVIIRPAGACTLTARITDVVVRCKPIPLLRLALSGLSRARKPQEYPIPPDALRAALRTVVLSRATCVTICGRDTAIAFLDANLRVHAEPGSFSCALNAGRLCIGPALLIEKWRALVAFDGSTARLSSGEGRLFGGTITATGRIDLRTFAMDSACVSVFGIDCALANEAFKGDGLVRGRLFARQTIAGSLSAPQQLHSAGPITIDRAVIAGLAFQKPLVMAVLLPGLDTLRFSKVNSTCSFSARRMDIGALAGDGEDLDINASGWVDWRNRCDLRLIGIFTKEYSDRFNEIARESLVPADNGGRSFKCRLRGRLDDPKIEIDREIISRTVQNAVESLMQQFIKR
jgi:hypothetical protein